MNKKFCTWHNFWTILLSHHVLHDQHFGETFTFCPLHSVGSVSLCSKSLVMLLNMYIRNNTDQRTVVLEKVLWIFRSFLKEDHYVHYMHQMCMCTYVWCTTGSVDHTTKRRIQLSYQEMYVKSHCESQNDLPYILLKKGTF